MPHDLLITGFGAFPGVKINPSARLANALGQDRRWARLGLKVRTQVLEVGYAVVRETFEIEAQNAPRAVLMFGVAARSKRVRIEMRAINRVSRTARDASRALPADGMLETGAGTFRPGRCEISGVLKAIRSGGVVAKRSHSAGRYVCNAAYWSALGAMPSATRVLFVHIPMLPRGSLKSAGTQPAFPRLFKGAKALALRMILSARLNS